MLIRMNTIAVSKPRLLKLVPQSSSTRKISMKPRGDPFILLTWARARSLAKNNAVQAEESRTI
jgi:hypothetical protein